MDTHRAAAHFPAVQRQVVGLGQALAGIGGHQDLVAVLGAGEGMVAGRPALVFLVVFEHREIDHPQRLPGLAVDVALFVAELAAQCAERIIDHLGLVGAEEDQVAGLGAGALDDGLQRGLVQVLDDGRLQAFLVQLRCIVDLDVGQAAGAVDLDELGVAVDLAAGQGGATGDAQRGDASAGRGRTAEHLEGDIGTASVTSVSSSVTRRSGLSEP
jgi:hypothetical protein